MACFKLYFGNLDAPEAGETMETQASSVEEAWAKGQTMSPSEMLALEDVFVLEQQSTHLAGTTREEWRSTSSGAGLTTVRGLV